VVQTPVAGALAEEISDDGRRAGAHIEGPYRLAGLLAFVGQYPENSGGICVRIRIATISLTEFVRNVVSQSLVFVPRYKILSTTIARSYL
jgi:hypothetical protein